jgi:hypothetical protein
MTVQGRESGIVRTTDAATVSCDATTRAQTQPTLTSQRGTPTKLVAEVEFARRNRIKAGLPSTPGRGEDKAALREKAEARDRRTAGQSRLTIADLQRAGAGGYDTALRVQNAGPEEVHGKSKRDDGQYHLGLG